MCKYITNITSATIGQCHGHNLRKCDNEPTKAPSLLMNVPPNSESKTQMKNNGNHYSLLEVTAC